MTPKRKKHILQDYEKYPEDQDDLPIDDSLGDEFLEDGDEFWDYEDDEFDDDWEYIDDGRFLEEDDLGRYPDDEDNDLDDEEE